MASSPPPPSPSTPPSLPRLRQVALVAADLRATCATLEAGLGLANPFHDPGVALFGLANAVYETGDCFIEVVSPTAAGTTAGRYLARRGGDAGYMAIFQVDDTPAARERVAARGLRVAWSVELDDASATHLHPKDVPGAIVSVDSARPAASWRWGGPRWTGGAPADLLVPTGGIRGLVVRLRDGEEGGATWAGVLDVPRHGNTMALDGGRQQIRFEPASGPADEGITTVELAGLAGEHTVCGVRFTGDGAARDH